MVRTRSARPCLRQPRARQRLERDEHARRPRPCTGMVAHAALVGAERLAGLQRDHPVVQRAGDRVRRGRCPGSAGRPCAGSGRRARRPRRRRVRKMAISPPRRRRTQRAPRSGMSVDARRCRASSACGHAVALARRRRSASGCELVACPPAARSAQGSTCANCCE